MSLLWLWGSQDIYRGGLILFCLAARTTYYNGTLLTMVSLSCMAFNYRREEHGKSLQMEALRKGYYYNLTYERYKPLPTRGILYGLLL